MSSEKTHTIHKRLTLLQGFQSGLGAAVTTDKDREYFNEDYLDSLIMMQHSNDKSVLKFVGFDLVLLLIIYLTLYDVNIEFSGFGVKFSDIPGFIQILGFISAAIAFYVIMFMIFNKMIIAAMNRVLISIGDSNRMKYGDKSTALLRYYILKYTSPLPASSFVLKSDQFFVTYDRTKGLILVKSLLSLIVFIYFFGIVFFHYYVHIKMIIKLYDSTTLPGMLGSVIWYVIILTNVLPIVYVILF